MGKNEVSERTKQDTLLRSADKQEAEKMTELSAKMTANQGTMSSQINQVSTAVASEAQTRASADKSFAEAVKNDKAFSNKLMDQLKNTVNKQQETTSGQLVQKFDKLQSSVKGQEAADKMVNKKQDAAIKPNTQKVAALENAVKSLTQK